jgi:putative inorganic carbon (hco3(-)) transporter
LPPNNGHGICFSTTSLPVFSLDEVTFVTHGDEVRAERGLPTPFCAIIEQTLSIQCEPRQVRNMKGLLFTFGLTYGGAVVSLFNPFIGLLIYIAFAILRPEFLWYWSVPEGNYSRIVAVSLLVGWTLRGFGKWDFGRAKVIVWSLIGYLGWSAVSAATLAQNKELAWEFVESLAKIVLPFLVGISLIDSLAKLKQLAWVILLSEGFLAYEFNLGYFSGNNFLWTDAFGGLDNNCHAIALVACVGLAGFLGFASRNGWQKAIAFGSAALMGHAILFSFSRGGMLALIVTGVVAFYLIPKRPGHVVGLLIGAALMIWLAGPQVIERFATVFADSQQRDESAESRVVLWRACIQTMWEHPLGIGAGNWGETSDRFGFYRGKRAHTLWLEIGAELGVPGLGLLLIFYGACIIRLLPMTSEKTAVPDPWFHDLSRMVTAALIGFAVAAQFVSLSLLEHPYYIALIGAGLLKIKSTSAGQGRQPGVIRLRRSIACGL